MQAYANLRVVIGSVQRPGYKPFQSREGAQASIGAKPILDKARLIHSAGLRHGGKSVVPIASLYLSQKVIDGVFRRVAFFGKAINGRTAGDPNSPTGVACASQRQDHEPCSHDYKNDW